MRNTRTYLVAVALLCVALAVPAAANIKWIQNPDLDVTGVNVDVTHNFQDMYLLADDFLCTQTGPLTEISIWGSWAHDAPPMGDPHAVEFILAIHADIPADQNPDGYSKPGELLWIWNFIPGDFIVASNPGVMKGWFSPPALYWYPCCEVVHEYIFPLDQHDPFVQQGTPAEPIVYWLAVQAVPLVERERSFGWLSSLDHWNDDGVWGVGLEPYHDLWSELVYPVEHEFAGESIDLAFRISGEGENEGMDWGDAPDPTYPTLAMSNGASHLIVPGGPVMGPLIDSEFDGQPDAMATGDDLANMPDEDGVTFTSPLTPGGPATVDIDMTASMTDGYINAWVDFDQNGSWAELGDQILSGRWVPAGMVTTLNFVVPPSAAPGLTFARFRLSSQDVILFFGPADDGEVEDYAVMIEGGSGEWKWEQAPDLSPMGIDINASPEPGNYILADDFLCVEAGPITDIHIFGSWLHDFLPFGGDPYAVRFTLSFHMDIPADEENYSRPGEVLWVRSFEPGEFEADIFADQIEEGWMDPPAHYFFPGDHICWLYKFRVESDEAFFQEGTPDEPVVYWLDLKAEPLDPEALFGWKTTYDHWNDNAVWGSGFEPYPGPWNELIYPPNHEMHGLPIDLAFVLFGGEVTAVTPSDLPQRSQLQQNMPNPFNPQTVIRYELTVGGHVQLDIFDSRGRLVRGLVNEDQNIGLQNVTWDGRDNTGQDQPSGVYFYRLRTQGNDESMKMVLFR